MIGNDSAVFMNAQDFAVVATFTAASTMVKVNGILEKEHANMFGEAVSSKKHDFTIFSSDLPADCKKGDPIEINNLSYLIFNISPGDPGLTVLSVEPL